jgi:hypothetical protein
MTATIAAPLRRQPNEAVGSIVPDPPLSSPERNLVFLGEASERHPCFKMRLKQSEPLEGLCSGVLRELCQGGWSAIQEPPRPINTSQKRGFVTHPSGGVGGS